MAPTVPSPSTWTIRFKHHKTTVLLHIEASQTISSIKEELLNVLKQTCPDGTSEGTLLPESGEEIQLARPLDINDVSAGWRRLAAGDSVGKGKMSKGKGKEKAGSEITAKGVDAESLKSLGFKDNAVLAFRFASEIEAEELSGRKTQTDVLGDEDDEMGLEEDEGDIKENWDVVIPTWEDQYGEETKGDVGAIPTFNG